MTYWNVDEEPSVEKSENRGSIILFNTENEKKKLGLQWEAWCWWSGGGGTEGTATKVAKLFPLVLLVKVSAGKVKCWEAKKAVMENGLLDYGVEEKNLSI